MKPNQFVTLATLDGNLGSLGDAKNKLLRQKKFPLWYCEQKYVKGAADNLDYDYMFHADSDRVSMWDYEHSCAVSKKYFGRPGYSDHDIERLSESKVIDFLKEILKVDEKHSHRKWTGYRITGTVNMSNGYCMLSLNLFSKGNKTDTEVYSGYENVVQDHEEAWTKECQLRKELEATLTESS